MTQLRDAPATSRYPRMTYEEYLDNPSIEEHTEWVDGEVVPMMSISRAHAELTMFLSRLLGEYIEERKIGVLLRDPFQMKTGPQLNGRAPDLQLVRTENLGRLGEKHLEGPADLVIEIISPGTEHTDRGDKFVEYERGGVPEYWILDPLREIAEFFVRDEQGLFRGGEVSADGMFESPALDGLKVNVEWFWERPPVGPLLVELGIR